MMLCIGLTGNIGSGKSTVLRLFETLGVKTASADALVHDLTRKGGACLKAIHTRFGDAILTESGELNRSALRQIISQSKDDKAWLEALLHPRVRQKLEQIVRQANAPYTMLEIPLLFSLKYYPYIQRVLLVSAPEATQIARIVARDNTSPEKARDILALQPDMAERRKLAHDEIINDGDLTHLEQQVVSLHAFYMQLAGELL